MTLLEIKEKIDQNNKLIKEALSPNIFTLNRTVKALLDENKKLQDQCTHNFVDGYCEYCYKQQED